jgi:hypothetical protein
VAHPVLYVCDGSNRSRRPRPSGQRVSERVAETVGCASDRRWGVGGTTEAILRRYERILDAARPEGKRGFIYEHPYELVGNVRNNSPEFLNSR